MTRIAWYQHHVACGSFVVRKLAVSSCRIQVTTAKTFIGGARLGWLYASWPFARLNITAERLEIASILATHSFSPEEVVSVDSFTLFPLLGWGVRVEHTRADVPDLVVFWSVSRPTTVANAISASGFEPTGDPTAKRPAPDFPVRPGFLALAVGLLFALILFEIFWHQTPGRFIWGPGVFVALGLVLLGSLLVRIPGRFQRFVLTTDALPRIQSSLNFIAVVAGVMLFGGALLALAG